ncbi:lysozyme family protein [Enterococcus saccharolyticus]|nr:MULTISPECIES: lysozyme family protein [Enterococcus]MCD5001127.1 lysozyme family protein [Enterococcus saccharolyticus]
MRKKTFFRRMFRLFLIGLIIFLAYIGYRNYRILRQVYQYEEQVAYAVEKNGIPEYKELAMSIIMTETKGTGQDLMQSSESAYGEPNKIQNANESIDQGVHYLAQAIERAENQHTDLWTAVQAYNFGLDYIDFVAKHGGKNSLDLAEEYSKEVLSPLLGNPEKTTYRYLGVQSVIYNGGYLYHNGGNLFYAELVKLNEQKIKWTSRLF